MWYTAFLMAGLIIALFIILVAWGWYLIPKKSGAQKTSTLSFFGQQSKGGQSSGVTVIPVSYLKEDPGHDRLDPIGREQRPMASARRRRVRTFLVVLAFLSVAAALYTGSLNWWLAHIGIDALLVIYYGLAMQFQSSNALASYSPGSMDRGESVSLLRKVAGG